MAKITLDDVNSGYQSTDTYNSNINKIEAEFNSKVLYRDAIAGESNNMNTLLDMNSNRIINGGDAINPGDYVTLRQLTSDIPSIIAVGNTDRIYATVAAALADAAAWSENDIIRTVAYSGSANSASGNTYRVIPVTAFPEDGGAIIKLPLAPTFELAALFPGNYFDVRQWGVVADGVTNDTDAMNAAATYVALLDEKLHLPSDVTIKADFTIPNNLILYSERGCTLQRWTGGTIPALADANRIFNVTWDAEDAATVALDASGSTSSELIACGFINGTAYGLQSTDADPATGLTCKECLFLGNGSDAVSELDGGVFFHGTNSEFLDCVSTLNNGNGYTFRTSTVTTTNNIVVHNCSAAGNTQNGFKTSHNTALATPWTRTHDIRFDLCRANLCGDNTLTKEFAGFAIWELEYGALDNCVSVDNYGHGFEFRDGRYNKSTSLLSENNDLSGIYVYGNTGRAEDTESGERLSTFSSFTCDNNGDSTGTVGLRNGITIGSSCSSNTYRDFRIVDSNQQAIVYQTNVGYADTNEDLYQGGVSLLNGGGADDKIDFTAAPSIEDRIRGYYYVLQSAQLVKITLGGEQASEGVVELTQPVGTTLQLTPSGSFYRLTHSSGASVYDTISEAYEGRRVTIFVETITAGSVQFADTGHIDLGNYTGSPYTASVGDILEFVYFNSVWHLTKATTASAGGGGGGAAAYGSMYFNRNASATGSITPTVYQDIPATYVAGPDLLGVSHASGVLTYTGSVTRKFQLTCNFHVQAPGSSSRLRDFQIHKNGTTPVANLKMRVETDGNDGENCTINGIIELAQNDTVRLKGTDAVDTDAIVVEDLHFTIVAIS
jgi:hypothetical protein